MANGNNKGLKLGITLTAAVLGLLSACWGMVSVRVSATERDIAHNHELLLELRQDVKELLRK
jgi:hypothetical protein